MVNGQNYSAELTRKVLTICVASVIGILVTCVPAIAHKVNVFAYVEGNGVKVEGYFSGNVKAQDCDVTVSDEQGKKLLEGKTDKEGIYSFKLADLPAFSGGLKIVLEAGMGHRAEYTLAGDDIPAAVKKQIQPEEKQSQETKPEPSASVSPSSSSPAHAVDQDALTSALEAAMDKKLAPITRMLGKQEKLLLEQKFGGPKLSEIIGGIGWIVGMVGISAFFWSRNSDRKKS